jgi:NAD(P)-dependent dehydrogenase (short-subunit alcohol dehydrogenase family)
MPSASFLALLLLRLLWIWASRLAVLLCLSFASALLFPLLVAAEALRSTWTLLRGQRRLDGCVVLIFGCNSSFGRLLVGEFAARGAEVFACDVVIADLQRTFEEDPKVRPVRCDALLSRDVEKVIGLLSSSVKPVVATIMLRSTGSSPSGPFKGSSVGAAPLESSAEHRLSETVVHHAAAPIALARQLSAAVRSGGYFVLDVGSDVAHPGQRTLESCSRVAALSALEGGSVPGVHPIRAQLCFDPSVLTMQKQARRSAAHIVDVCSSVNPQYSVIYLGSWLQCCAFWLVERVLLPTSPSLGRWVATILLH